jgi:hypothetical protein
VKATFGNWEMGLNQQKEDEMNEIVVFFEED